MTVRYEFDPRQSRFTVQAFATGLLSALGHSPLLVVHKFTGELRISPDAPADAAVQISVRAESLEVTGDVSTKDRTEIERQMRQDVLEVSAHPEIKFQSTQVAANKLADNLYQLQIEGDFSLHGVTKRERINAQLKLRDDEARLTGEHKLLQSHYRIKPVTALAGTIKLKDELKITFDLRARRVE